MSRFDVVSVDMFQTLIDVNSQRHYFWQKILGKNYSEGVVDEYTKQWGKRFPNHFNRMISRKEGFVCLKEIFEGFWNSFFKQFNIDFDHRKATQIHIDIHRFAPPYEDTEIFLNTIKEHFPLCLVTDSDDEMVLSHLEKYRFDQVFISERLKTYKNDPDNKMFQAVVQHYSIAPEKILHIGDMFYDVVGANNVGITTCWLNREGKNWSNDINPDYEIISLIEIFEILGILRNTK